MVPLGAPEASATSITMFGPGPSSDGGAATSCAAAMPAAPAASATESSSLRIGCHLDRDHPVRAGRRLAPRDLVHMLHPGNHLPIDGILPVQEIIVLEVDEEL